MTDSPNTTKLSRRSLLASLPAMTGAIPAVAATALGEAPTEPAVDYVDYDPKDMLARAEGVVELLRNRVVDRSPWEWAIDDAAAERMLQYFRAAADGYDGDEGWDAFKEFCDTHGVGLLVWILFGDPAGLIAGAALRSKRGDLCRTAQNFANVYSLGGRPLRPWKELIPEVAALPIR